MRQEVMFSCGHRGPVDLPEDPKQQIRRIKYFEKNGMCKDCYKKMMQEKQAREPFTFNYDILPYKDKKDGSELAIVWFSGNNLPHKDEIKQIGGYKWKARGYSKELCWNKIIKSKNLQEEIAKAAAIGAVMSSLNAPTPATPPVPTTPTPAIPYSPAAKVQARPAEKPVAPQMILGHRWNRKVYGRSGGHVIYLDDQKTYVTDTEADELKRYVELRASYSEAAAAAG